jgi:hypothetical protein
VGDATGGSVMPGGEVSGEGMSDEVMIGRDGSTRRRHVEILRAPGSPRMPLRTIAHGFGAAPLVIIQI